MSNKILLAFNDGFEIGSAALNLPNPSLQSESNDVTEMEGCRFLHRSRCLLRFSIKAVKGFSHSNIRSAYGRNINCFTPHRHLSLFSNASFHCHGVQRSFTSSSSDGSKDPQNGKNGKEMDINQQKDPKVTQEANGSTAGSSGDPEKKLSVFQRFKQTYKEHGKVLIIVEVVTSIFWYGLFYFIVTCGVDVIALLEKMELSEKIIQPFRSSSLGDFVIAFLLYKLISPIRYAVTLGGTGYIIRWMRRRGKLPPVTPSTQLRTLYKDSREEIRTKSVSFRERRRSKVKARGKKKRGQKQ